MLKSFASLDFADLPTAIPAFLIVVTIPLTFSIAHGIGLGLITYVLIKLATSRPRDVHPLLYVVAALFGVYFY